MVSRPDELANLSREERDQAMRSNIKSGVKTAATLGAGALAGGTGLASKVMPFLSSYIPTDLAMKGINKVAPKIGAFLQKGQSMGLDLKEGMDFVKNKMESVQSQPQTAKDNRSIIEQYSPELFQFIQQEVQRGKTPIQAAGDAQTKVKWSSKFKDVIKKMEKDHKTPFSTIVESIFGGGQMEQPNPQQNTPVNQPSFADDVRQGLQQHLPEQNQPGPVQGKLEALIQQYIQSKGR